MASQRLRKRTSVLGLVTRHNLAVLALTFVLIPKLSSAQTPGTLAPNFGPGGQVTTDFDTPSAARTVAVQADGKPLAAGVAIINGAADFALARYNSDGTLDATFSIVTTAFDFPGNFDR